MPERSDRLDFYIRDQTSRPPIEELHKHEYFQIQINLGGDTEQHIGGATRPFPPGAIAFVLPHRLHLIPHPASARFVVINFAQGFLFPQMACADNGFNLDEVPTQSVPELAPFRFQEQQDFILSGADLDEVRALLARMAALNERRSFGAVPLLRGCLLQLIGLVCQIHAEPLARLTQSVNQHHVRKDALAPVEKHIRDNLTHAGLSLASAAAAGFVSPNYLAYLIKRETGKTFVNFVTERRIALAKELLVGTHRQIKDIALSVGYQDETYFARRFRQVVGQSPSTFRAGQQAQAVEAGSEPSQGVRS
jgi:AraC-like DNA-binding protein